MEKLKALAPLISRDDSLDYFTSKVVTSTPHAEEVCRFLCEMGIPIDDSLLHRAGIYLHLTAFTSSMADISFSFSSNPEFAQPGQGIAFVWR